MSGERSQQFRTTPGYNAPDANPAASIRTNQTQAVAAQVQGQGSALAGLGGALSNFFSTVNKTVEQVGQIDHMESRAEIERQRKARAVQGQADHASGEPRDESLNVYQDYKGAYDIAVADESASKISADLQGFIRNLPDTPGQDVTAMSVAFVKDQMKGGTGDPAVDGRIAYVVKQRADQLIAHKTEQIAQVAESNIAATIGKSISRKIQERQGATVEQVDGLYSEALGLMKGDIAKADRFFTQVLTSAIYNPGQARSVLAAMHESEFGKRNPDVYLDLTEKAWTQTNRVKSVAAGEAVQRVNLGYHAASAGYRNAGGIMPVDEYLGWMTKANDVHTRHGVGLQQFPWMVGDLDRHARARKDLQTQAGANVIVQSVLGMGDGDLRRNLSNGTENEEEFGKVISKHLIPAINTLMAQPQYASSYPALAAAQQPGGGYNFLATRESAKDTGRLLGATPAAYGYTVDDNTAAQVSNGLLGGDPQKTINAVELLNTLENTPGGELFVRNILKSSEAKVRYAVIKERAKDGGLENAARMVSADKTLEGREGKEIQDGRIDWKRASKDPEAKPMDITNRIAERARDVLLKDQDRTKFFGFNPKVNLAPALQEKLERLTSRHMYEQQANLPLGVKPDIGAAAEWAANEIKAEAIPLTAQNGVLRYVPDLYGGKGRIYKDPVAIYNGQRVYAGMKMQNRLGQEEDPQKTFTNIDRPALAKVFPGFLGNPNDAGEEQDIYLMPPDQKPGLMQVMTNGQRPLAFYAGMPVRIGDKDLKVPASPADADNFFRSNLPAGFHAVAGAPDGSGRNTYRIHYGYRITGDDNAVQKIEGQKHWERQAEIKQVKEAMDPVTGAVQNQRTPMNHPNYRKP